MTDDPAQAAAEAALRVYHQLVRRLSVETEDESDARYAAKRCAEALAIADDETALLRATEARDLAPGWQPLLDAVQAVLRASTDDASDA